MFSTACLDILSQGTNALHHANIQSEFTRMPVYVCLGRLQASEILSYHDWESFGQISDT